MLSIDKILTSSARAAKRALAERWLALCRRYGPPPENSPLGSLHYLLTEYAEPHPAERILPYKMDLGSLAVTKSVVQLPLESGPNVSVTVVSPRDEVPKHCVVISPGLAAHTNATRYLEEHLASHGFLVVRPRHRGSDWLAVAWKTPLGAFTRTEFRRRLEEVERVIEALLHGDFGYRFTEREMALAGHSFGALTCSVLAGLPARDIVVERARRFGALIAFSPYGDSFPTRRLGIDVEGFGELETPTLFMSGTRDELFTLGKGSKAHLEPFRLARDSSVCRHVVIGKTRHGSFSELFGWVRRETRVMVNSTVTAFLDAHLKECPDSRDYLDKRLSLAAFEYGSWAL